MFERSKLELLRDVSVTRIGDTLSYGFPQTDCNKQSLKPDFINSTGAYTGICYEMEDYKATYSNGIYHPMDDLQSPQLNK